jgi:hypothetical protein
MILVACRSLGLCGHSPHGSMLVVLHENTAGPCPQILILRVVDELSLVKSRSQMCPMKWSETFRRNRIHRPSAVRSMIQLQVAKRHSGAIPRRLISNKDFKIGHKLTQWSTLSSNSRPKQCEVSIRSQVNSILTSLVRKLNLFIG